MPIVHVHLLAGRSPAEKQALARELTAAVERTVGSDASRVHVLVTEYQPGEWSLGGEPLVVPSRSSS